MRHVLWWVWVCALLAGLVGAPPSLAVASTEPINRRVGDASWPGPGAPADAPDDARIRAHLDWVGQVLGAADTSHLRPAARAARAELLGVLADYAAAGVFPRHDAWGGGRRPRFVDTDGRLCAVGFLIAATEGRALAEELGAAYEYAYLEDIDDPRVAAWADASGFSIDELATIQPGYTACDAWGHGPDTGAGDCAAEFKGAHPWLVGLGLGGGITAADDAAHSYFLWGVDVRYALTPWLSIGVGDLGVRVGSSMADGDYAALTATPLLELARYKPGEGTTQSDATFVDAGLTVQRLLGTELGAPTPLALTAAIGKRWGIDDLFPLSVRVGVTVPLTDGAVIDDRLSAGSVAPFVQLGAHWNGRY